MKSNCAPTWQDQQRIGIKTQVITAEEMKQIEPEANIEGLTYVAYEPDSGFADPNATTYAFAKRAQELGVRVMTHTTVTAIRTETDRVVGVDTTAGPIDAPTVVLAGGAWADRLLKPLGLDLGLISYRSQVVIFRRPYGSSGPRNVFIDTVANSWFRPEGESGILIGAESGGTGVDPDSFSETVDGDQVEMARAKLATRFPSTREATMRGGWAGMYMLSPDHHPIIDQPPSVPGLFIMAGDSGTSFKTSPAIGKCMSEWITGGEPVTADLTPFRASRFAEGKPWQDETNYGYRNRTISR